MVPPTGVADSILLARRNGASLDTYHGAPTTQPKSYTMESNCEYRGKKLWKAGKSGRFSISDPSTFVVHPDYLHKYGTLSNGVVTKSMRNGDTWFYGTVGIRGSSCHRPSLFLYPGVVKSAPRMLSHNGHPGYPSQPGTSPFVPVPISKYPCTDRNATINKCQKSEARSLLKTPECQCSERRRDVKKGAGSHCRKCRGKKAAARGDRKTEVPCENPVPAQDPYNLMRKNRLTVTDAAAEPFIYRSQANRKNIISSMRSKVREMPGLSFETFKPKRKEMELKREDEWSEREEEEEEEEKRDDEERPGQGDDEDSYKMRRSILECEMNAYELNGNDSDSDSSDELVEEVNNKVKILRPKLKKTDAKKVNIKPGESGHKTEVTVSGQRFKIFDHSSPSAELVEGYVSDEHEKRLPSPKRPPRRLKHQSSHENHFKYSKSKSKSSPNLSIKSILKKSSGNEDANESSSSSSSSSFSFPDSPHLEEQSSSGMEDPRRILLRSVQISQNTFKKKKQVQFKVNVSNESLTEKTDPGPNQKLTHETLHRSISCEDLLLTLPHQISHLTANCDNQQQESLLAEQHEEEEEATGNSTLRRSCSERRRPATGASELPKNEHCHSGPVCLFNDTMALRMRSSQRADTRDIFAEGEYEFDIPVVGKEIRINRPKEAPPEPPINPGGNVISYAEFAKLADQSCGEKSPCSRRFRCKSLDYTVSLSKCEKTPPSPPPRQMHIKWRKLSNPLQHEMSSVDGDNSSLVKIDGTSEREESALNKTIVTVTVDNSIAIHPGTSAHEFVNTGKTSVMINNFNKEDCNKVTISLRNESPEQAEEDGDKKKEGEEPNSSSCTIIETGSNSTVIPVMSTNNKTTLIVGNSSAVAVIQPEKAEKPSQYIFSNVNAAGEGCSNSAVTMDPVEAIRRNLIPHICGKEEVSKTLMEKIRQSRESADQKNRQISRLFSCKRIDQETANFQHHSESLLAAYQSKRNLLTSWRKTANGPFNIEDDAASLTESFTGSLKNSSTNTSRSNSFRSSSTKNPDSDCDCGNPFAPDSTQSHKYCALPDPEEAATHEKDKLEDEYEIRSGISDTKKDDEDNIYETIKEEPIYDQISVKPEAEESDDDIPPPLPLTLPPSLDEPRNRSPKSIFEGATKYDILSYLVDAKDRVQEETYFSGSSTSEEIDHRRFSLADEPERTSFDSGMHCTLPSDSLDADEPLPNKRETDLASRISQISQTSDSSDENLILVPNSDRESGHKINRKSSAEVERNDSGVGSETSQTSRSKWQASTAAREHPRHLCEDCDQPVETQVTDSGVMYAPLVCRKCSKRRSERKEIIQEIVETEEKYGRDLKIILEEFYRPMLVAGLLTPDQLSAIFLNTEELLENNEQLTEKLRDTLEIASEQGDEDLLTVNIGKLFLQAGPMLHAFETYCTRQATAALLLANLEKEKELLRIFLRVSQMENTVLRRMNLNSFLMVPVQRVTKYPLLLARLYKVTPTQHESRELLKEAQHNIELHLEHMNSEAKDLSAIKVWRRFSASNGNGRKSTAELEMINIKLRKMAIDVLEWNHEEVRFVMEGKLLYTQPTDNNWKRGRTIKLSPVFVLLVTLGKPNSKYKSDPTEEELTFPKKTGVREATLLLVKEKCGRYTLIRQEPLFLDKLIVCCETDADEYFEIQELSTKDTIIFKAEDGERTKEWYRQLQYHAQILGSWRRRRNALANIMINGMMARTYTN